jgi:EAL domain-containing protein (putative c-di-GMP-specific phosphodiesterase class I)
MPVLEETGLIVEVGCWVVREVVRQVQSWQMLYGRHIVDWVSINLSTRQFDDPARLREVLRTIDADGFSLHRLMLEIAGANLMRDPNGAAVLDELRNSGLRIAVDGFGSGGFPLHHPVDMVKIDREIVAQIGGIDGEKLVQGLLRLAQIYSAAIVAEGVETAAQRDFLREAGCRFAQGYFFAQPMDGPLLGAYALTHGADDGRDPAHGRLVG